MSNPLTPESDQVKPEDSPTASVPPIPTSDPITPERLFHIEELPEEYDEEIIDLADARPEDEYSRQERALLEGKYLETMRVFGSGELVMGKIVAINDADVTIDIGFKSEGAIPVEEFDNLSEIKVGDFIEVLIESVEDAEGTLLLSRREAQKKRVWERINTLYQTGEMVEAQISRRIKGGMVVDLFGIEAFLPGSQIDVHPIRDFDAIVGAKMDFRIIKVNNIRKNVVLSHKVLVEESLREIRSKVLAELEEGQVVEGVVKNITDFGVFVDLGGVDGLLHITDLSWGRVSHPSDVVKLDERIRIKVLHYDREKQRISLGLKQLTEHHWDKIDEKFPVGAKVRGKVVSIVKYGAFIELEPGIEGLVHISEMSWTQHIKHPSQLVNVGDEIDIVILNVDSENRKISMGMKQCEPDPWERLEQFYLPGTRHKGTVRDLVPFGAFVELEPGIDGLIHISDLSWTRKVRHPGEIVKKAQEIEIVILNFDRNERRIALGYKQLEADPWDRFEREYPIRSQTEGSIIRVLEKGVVVMLPLGVEGFVPNSQLGKTLAGDNKKNIKEGDNLAIEVIEFDKSNHRIVLSHSSVERTKERAVYRSYQESAEEVKTTLGDVMREIPTSTETTLQETKVPAPLESAAPEEAPPMPAPAEPPDVPIQVEPAPAETAAPAEVQLTEETAAETITKPRKRAKAEKEEGKIPTEEAAEAPKAPRRKKTATKEHSKTTESPEPPAEA
jgi:small subunit ribosomal protein S1